MEYAVWIHGTIYSGLVRGSMSHQHFLATKFQNNIPCHVIASSCEIFITYRCVYFFSFAGSAGRRVVR